MIKRIFDYLLNCKKQEIQLVTLKILIKNNMLEPMVHSLGKSSLEVLNHNFEKFPLNSRALRQLKLIFDNDKENSSVKSEILFKMATFDTIGESSSLWGNEQRMQALNQSRINIKPDQSSKFAGIDKSLRLQDYCI